jgi:hypothetical protein
MNKLIAALIILLVSTGCATTGNDKLDATLMSSVVNEGETTRATVIDMFGEPHQTLEIDHYTLLGYRKIDLTMSPWTLVPFVGLVVGGGNREFTTCIVKIDNNNDVVTSVKCLYRDDFQYNMETAIGKDLNEDELLDIFNQVE